MILILTLAALLPQFCTAKLGVKAYKKLGGIFMGGRDYRHREAKKAKKSSGPAKGEMLAPSAEVQIARKKKSRKGSDQ